MFSSFVLKRRYAKGLETHIDTFLVNTCINMFVHTEIKQ